MSQVLTKLRDRFDPRVIKTRTQGGKELQYVDISATINRLLDSAGMDWDWIIVKNELQAVSSGYLGYVEGELVVYEDGKVTRRHGVGVGVNKDPDTAIKTADAEALKKAGHKFGIGLELWDEEVRSQNEAVIRGMGSNDLDTLKNAVFQLALVNGAEASADGVAEYYGVKVKDLQEADTLKELLNRPVSV